MQALNYWNDLVSLQRCSEQAIATSLFSLQLNCHVVCDVAWERSIRDSDKQGNHEREDRVPLVTAYHPTLSLMRVVQMLHPMLNSSEEH